MTSLKVSTKNLHQIAQKNASFLPDKDLQIDLMSICAGVYSQTDKSAEKNKKFLESKGIQKELVFRKIGQPRLSYDP